MIIPPPIRRRSGIAASTKAFDCSTCGASIRFDIIYLITLEDWPEFVQIVRDKLISEIICEHCGSDFTVRFPVIVEVQKRNLLVFATHGGDDGGAPAGFRKWLEFAEELVEPVVAQRLANRPFTFVHGWTGLLALLSVFEGDAIIDAVPPYPHSTDASVSVATTDGFIYGKLFFYYPDQIAVNALVHALLRFSEDAESSDRKRRILQLMLQYVDHLGANHPWIVQEIGRLSLDLGEIENAKLWLSQALVLQHKWIAPTLSFADVTPTRRANAEPQDALLPHVQPASVLGNVLALRHTVTRVWPCKDDYGLWHFPVTEKACVPDTFSPENVLTVTGIILGELERDVWDRDISIGSFAFLAWCALLQHTDELLSYFDSHEQSRVTVEFWKAYLFTTSGLDLQSPVETIVAMRIALENKLEKFRKEFAVQPPRGLIGFMKYHLSQERIWEGAINYLVNRFGAR